MTDSGGAGKYPRRFGNSLGGRAARSGRCFIDFGEGRRIPAMGAAGAVSKMIDRKVGRVEIKRGGKVEIDPQQHDRNDQAERDDHQHESRRRRLWRPLRAADREGRLRTCATAWSRSKARAEDYGVVIREREDARSRYRRDQTTARRRFKEETPQQRSGIAMSTKYRLGIDAGGTFTDLVMADPAWRYQAVQVAVDARQTPRARSKRA